MPTNHADAMRLQATSLEEATHSCVTSRVHSRVHSVAPSLIASAIQSRRASKPMSTYGSTAASRRGSIAHGLHFQPNPTVEDGSSPETLENLIRVTQMQDSVLQAYYTNDEGHVVTLSLYDISSTDPADILGNDVLAQHQDEEEDVDFNEAVYEKLLKHRHRRRSLQRSGDSYNGQVA